MLYMLQRRYCEAARVPLFYNVFRDHIETFPEAGKKDYFAAFRHRQT
jgi:hypothetical protein